MTQIPQRVLGEALLRSAGKSPQKTVAIVKGIEYSYEQLKNEAVQLANYLVKSGIQKGDRVAIYMNNSWECIVSIYGATLAGAAFLIINPQTKANKLQYILEDSGAKILLSEINLKYEFSRALQSIKKINELIVAGKEDELDIPAIKITSFGNIIQQEFENVLPQIIPNDLGALIYTSGSTGFPKGVVMTHQSMVFTSWSLIEYLRLVEDERILLLSPLAFDYGLYQLFMAVTIGGTLIVEQSFTFPATIYNNIQKYKPTVIPGVPTIYAMMIASNKSTPLCFESVKKVTNTAAKLPSEFIPELKSIFPNALIFKMYGLTECKRVCYLEPELIDEKTDSVGKAIPGTEVYLLDLQGNKVNPGGTGILHIRGPHVMVGYWNKKELTNEMIKPGFLPGEKVLCSNDWFRMDEEGFLYFQGRNDDIIKTRGEKVSPVEIENIIYKLKEIKEVAVVGIPDEVMGEAIVAFVTTYENSTIDQNTILRECTAHLESFMIPKSVVIIDAMPKSTNGKIDKKELTQRFLSNE